MNAAAITTRQTAPANSNHLPALSVIFVVFILAIKDPLNALVNVYVTEGITSRKLAVCTESRRTVWKNIGVLYSICNFHVRGTRKRR